MAFLFIQKEYQNYENIYNFIHITPTEFETNNSNISLTIFDENKKKKEIYTTKNDSANKGDIVQLKNNIYAALRSLRNKFMRLEKMLKSFSHKELKEYILNHIYTNDSNSTNDSNDSNK